jgi:hypothetical protein
VTAGAGNCFTHAALALPLRGATVRRDGVKVAMDGGPGRVFAR